LYAGELPIDHPHVSPINADVRGFPRMQIFVATDDIAGPDALLFAEGARKVGAQVEVQIGPGLMHVWPLLPIPEAGTSREAMDAFLRSSVAMDQA
ncbi:MAG: alpha/beta hydrolase fold domain-containing protein, partial [Burkholderiales bacterium]|nr:alpha/beta hydrolase fold domain-containing protein [Burkholderiales bacterium]